MTNVRDGSTITNAVHLLTSTLLETSAKYIQLFTGYSVSKQLTYKQKFKTEKIEFQVLIKHYFLRGKTVSKTKVKLDKYYTGSSPSYGLVQK